MCLGHRAADGRGRPGARASTSRRRAGTKVVTQSGGARDDHYGEPVITGSDIDDLVIRVRRAAGDTAELEAAKTALFGTAGAAPAEAQLIRQRLLTIALHHGGDLLAKLLTRLGPRETAMVRRYAHRLGYFLETLEIWSASRSCSP